MEEDLAVYELKRLVQERVGSFLRDGNRAFGMRLADSIVSALTAEENRATVVNALGGSEIIALVEQGDEQSFATLDGNEVNLLESDKWTAFLFREKD